MFDIWMNNLKAMAEGPGDAWDFTVSMPPHLPDTVMPSSVAPALKPMLMPALAGAAAANAAAATWAGFWMSMAAVPAATMTALAGDMESVSKPKAAAKPKAVAKPKVPATPKTRTVAKSTITAPAKAKAAPAKPAPAKAVATKTTTKAPKVDDRPAGLDAPRGGKADDLKKISGVGPKLETVLNDLGIYHFDQVASWKAAEIAWVDDYLRFKGRIKRDGWIAQAKTLAKEVA